MHKLVKIKRISGQIEVLTGLHIGAGQDQIEIGGMDNPIIKHPVTGDPFIPGSSLKGKIRSLLELHLGKIGRDGQACDCRKCSICRIYGVSAKKGQIEDALGPTRVMFRDAFVARDSKLDDMNLIEEKHENSINRVTAMANPRPLERIVPGVKFDLEISYRVFAWKDDKEVDSTDFKNSLLKGMWLLELDDLGGGGSRGNGKIRFLNLHDEDGKSIDLSGIFSDGKL